MERYVKSVAALDGHPNIDLKRIEDTKKLVNEFLKGNDGPGSSCYKLLQLIEPL